MQDLLTTNAAAPYELELTAPRHAQAADLSSCASEPIHIPGSIQPGGVLLALDAETLTVEQASANTERFLGISAAAICGVNVSGLPLAEAPALTERIRRANLRDSPALLQTAHRTGTSAGFYVIAHRLDDTVILELEPVSETSDSAHYDLYSPVRSYLADTATPTELGELCQIAAHRVREITGFGRVLVYRFDDEFNGHVIAESKDADYSSYLDLWFPASDIPEQARRLYMTNRLRLIADARYTPVPIVPALNSRTGKPLDLSFSFLRSVSPVHIEYLHNMGVASSMSMSLLTGGGKLWGLVACHHNQARFIPFHTRSACDLIAQVISSQVELNEQRTGYEHRIELKSTTTRLLASMAEETEFVDGLVKCAPELLSFASATGAAVLYGGRCTCIGECPPETTVWQIVDWLVAHGREEIFHTDCLPVIIPETAAHKNVASGVLAISVSKIHRSYVLWFRPEVIRTVKWGGDPRKPVEASGGPEPRISPRKSFETWKELVEARSLPWHPAEIESVAELRNAIVGIVLRKAEELAQLTEELQRSNRELEAFSYSVSHDLRAPFRHIVGFSELLKQSQTASFDARDLRYIDTIIQSANFAGTLVDNLLSFSQVGRAKLKLQTIETAKLVPEVIRDLTPEKPERRIDWRIGKLPNVHADLIMFRLVWQNLIQNAMKYTRHREEAIIEIDANDADGETTFRVADNGIGFEQAYASKLFGVFQRLHRMEDYEGTGIGLANVRRIVSRHQGRTWAEGQPGKGATFYFSIPHKVDAEHA